MAMSQKALQKKRNKKKQSRQVKASKSFVVQPKHIVYSRWPLHECWVPHELWESGIGHVIVSRKNSVGEIAVGMYLLDVYCLGIKDCFLRLVSATGYKEMLEQVSTFTGKLQLVEPSYACTLIYKAAAYAQQFGFKAHPDFAKTRLMLRGIPEDPAQTFSFGKDNKPFYVQGPNESPSDVKRIMHTLQNNVGADKYHYLLEI